MAYWLELVLTIGLMIPLKFNQNDLHHKKPALDSNPKATHFSIPNAIYATKNVGIPLAIDFQAINIVDSPSPNHNR